MSTKSRKALQAVGKTDLFFFDQPRAPARLFLASATSLDSNRGLLGRQQGTEAR